MIEQTARILLWDGIGNFEKSKGGFGKSSELSKSSPAADPRSDFLIKSEEISDYLFVFLLHTKMWHGYSI